MWDCGLGNWDSRIPQFQDSIPFGRESTVDYGSPDLESWNLGILKFWNDMSDEGYKFKGAGGTEGGIAEFLIGLGMAIAGAYLLTNQVIVTSGFWSFFGFSAFGLSLIPLIFGIGILFFNGKSVLGWLLTFAGVVIIFAGILSNLHIYFAPTSLFNTILMLVLLAGGIGLIARGLRAHG